MPINRIVEGLIGDGLGLTTQAELDERGISVKAFGAKGDGITDDTAAINAAINALPASGGMVFIPEGTYMINAGNPYNTITNNTCINLKSNVRIQMSKNATLKAITNNFNNYAIFLVRGVSNITIEGGLLIGERYTHTGDVEGQCGDGIWLEGATDVSIKNVTFREFWGDGIYTKYHDTLGNTKNVSVQNCTFKENRRQGISICANENFRVSDCYFENTQGTDPASGIDIEPELGGTVKNVVITSNVFKGNKIGIQALGQSNGSIVGNIFEFNTMWGIYLADSSKYYTVSNNVISGSGSHGIYMNSSTNNAITGNTIYNNQGYGIYLLNYCNRNLVNNNRVYMNTGIGIGVYSSNDCTISGNNVTDNVQVGIDVEISINNVISGNTISYNSRSGINIWKCKSTIVDGNQCISNYQHGIILKGDTAGDSVNVSIINNMCLSNGQETTNFYQNISVASSVSAACSNVTIQGNICRAGAFANKPQYGIQISSGTTDTFLGNNDTRTGGVAGDILDNGTATVPAYTPPVVAAIDPTIFTSPSGLPYRVTVSDLGVASYTFAGLAYDLFDRADSTTSLGTMNTGNVWTSTGTWGISSNKAYSVSDADGNYTVIPALTTSDITMTCSVSGTIASASVYRIPQLMIRSIDANNFIRVYLMNGRVSLDKKDGGANGALIDAVTTTTDGVTYKLKVVCKGSNIKVYVDGVLKIDYTLSTADQTKFGSNKVVGLRLAKAGSPVSAARFDNLIIEATP